jgi:hypothetical protein
MVFIIQFLTGIFAAGGSDEKGPEGKVVHHFGGTFVAVTGLYDTRKFYGKNPDP